MCVYSAFRKCCKYFPYLLTIHCNRYNKLCHGLQAPGTKKTTETKKTADTKKAPSKAKAAQSAGGKKGGKKGGKASKD